MDSQFTPFKKQQSPVLDAQWRLFRAKAGASVVVLVALSSAVLAPRSDFTLYAYSVGSLLLLGSFYSAIRTPFDVDA